MCLHDGCYVPLIQSLPTKSEILATSSASAWSLYKAKRIHSYRSLPHRQMRHYCSDKGCSLLFLAGFLASGVRRVAWALRASCTVLLLVQEAQAFCLCAQKSSLRQMSSAAILPSSQPRSEFRSHEVGRPSFSQHASEEMSESSFPRAPGDMFSEGGPKTPFSKRSARSNLPINHGWVSQVNLGVR